MKEQHLVQHRGEELCIESQCYFCKGKSARGRYLRIRKERRFVCEGCIRRLRIVELGKEE